ncbi:MAG: ABC transporter permease [Chloroflexota bacterium]|nr:ABC transporter permease [Chloroflexota bacterium]
MATNTTVTATPLAQAAPIIAPKSVSMTQDAWRRFVRNKASLSGLVFIGVVVLAAIAAPIVAPYNFATQDVTATTQGIGSPGHLLGTDRLGRDILSRIIYGTRISLTVGLVIPIMIVLIGVPVGLVAGYKGGWVDSLLMRIVDVLYAIPSLLFIIIFMTYLKAQFLHINGGWLLPLKNFDAATGGTLGVFIGLSIFSWLTVSRLVRGQVLSLKRKEFVEAAHCMGASSGRIILRHLLPNTLAVVIVAATLGIPAAILGEAGISFIGLGINPPVPSWGLMISEGVADLRSYPYMLVAPAVVLSLTVLSFNFIGDGLRDAFDPWMKK